MQKDHKTKSELLKELDELRQQNIELKRRETEHKKTIEALTKSQNIFKMMIRNIPDSVALNTLDGTIIEASQGALDHLGCESFEDVIGKTGFKWVAKEERKRAKVSLQKVIDEGYLKNFESTYVRKDGTRIILESNVVLLKDDFGNPNFILISSRDITERKMAEKKLHDEVKKLREQIRLGEKYPVIIGNSPKILQVIDLIHLVARTDSTVLIYGETGSGKDLIAKAIHFNSPRKNAPFLAINCAALPEQLIESELFGYAKGAFTGATQDKKGLFEEASGGTIFLNEIGEMPLKVQAKLLQALENQEIRPLGRSTSIKVDVRIIAASNMDLEEAMKRRAFREDLFYRLNVLPIKVPPLRERKEDIPILAKHFLDKYCLPMNKHINDISPEAMDLLCNYTYPGNVRELENILQHSIVISKGSTIFPQNLPESLKKSAAMPVPESLADMEKKTIIAAIHECNGKLNCVAKKLGIHRSTLWRKMKRFGIKASNQVS
jgi:PAS domain S-box-containing protein